jgi:hypothetical protein
MRQADRFLIRMIIKASFFVDYEWHLTPRGWVLGDWSPNGICTETKTPPPVDRIETWVTTETSYDGWVTKAQTEWAPIWASPQHGEAERQILRSRHHKPQVRV